jgi:hypothetical protein
MPASESVAYFSEHPNFLYTLYYEAAGRIPPVPHRPFGWHHSSPSSRETLPMIRRRWAIFGSPPLSVTQRLSEARHYGFCSRRLSIIRRRVKKSRVVSISFLSSIATFSSGCSHAVHVHLNASGQCINEETGLPVEQRICYGYGGGYYGGVHYVYMPGSSATYYSSPSSPGYVAPWSSTVRGIFGGSAMSGEGSGAE